MATMLKVRVRTLGGVEHVLSSVDPAITIDALKDLLHNETSAPRDGMKLVYKGKELGGSLKDATFTDGDFIVIIVIAANSREATAAFAVAPSIVPPPKVAVQPAPVIPGMRKLKSNTASTPHDSIFAPRDAVPTPVPFTLTSPSSAFAPPHQRGLGLFGQAAHWDISPSNEQPPPSQAQPIAVDPSLVSQLTDMGFSGNRATRALVINRMNPQLAMEWLLDHAEDADASLDAPVTAESLSSMLTSVSRRAPPPARGPVAEDPALVQRLQEMGFPAASAAQALRATNNNYEAACNWLLADDGGQADEGGDDQTEQTIMRAVLSNPAVQGSLSNPRVMQAFRAMMEDPSAANNYLDDPEIGPVLAQVQTIVNTVQDEQDNDGDDQDEDMGGE